MNKPQAVRGPFQRWKDGLFPLPGKWECTEAGQRIVWTETGRQPTADWSGLLVIWTLVFAAILGVLALVMIPAGLLGSLSMLLRGVPLDGAADLDMLLWMLPGASAMMASTLAAIFLIDRHVFHAEFDLAGGTLLLREAAFPNRSSDIALPFADIVAIKLRRRPFDGPTDVQLLVREHGRERERTIGSELDAVAVARHLERLRLSLGARVQDPVVFDP